MTITYDATAPVRPARVRRRLIGVGCAVLAAVLIWTVAVPVLGVHLQGPAGPGSAELRPVVLPAVIAMSLGAPLAGWALIAVLERYTGMARTIWTIVALAALVISLGGPLLGTGVPTSSRIALALMHSVVGAIVIPVLNRTSPAS